MTSPHHSHRVLNAREYGQKKSHQKLYNHHQPSRSDSQPLLANKAVAIVVRGHRYADWKLILTGKEVWI